MRIIRFGGTCASTEDGLRMKIVVFGASVSAQTVRHGTDEVVGYCEVLRRRRLAALGASHLMQVCYPGNRLSDGGLYRLGDVIGHRPDLCLVEPLIENTSRGQPVTPDEAEFVYHSLLRGRILPVALFLPDPAKHTPRKWGSYALHERICRAIGVPCIEVNLSAVSDIEGCFNGVHTQLRGAELYADEIVRGLQAIPDRPSVAEQAFSAAAGRQATLYETTVQTPERTTPSTVVLRLRPRMAGAFSYRLIQPHQVGPFSPMITVDASGAPTQGEPLRSTWDPYCHYERRAHLVLDERSVGISSGACTVTIATSTVDPDYASVRQPVERWPMAHERRLRPDGPIKVFSTLPLDAELLRFD
jgi:hypothetical protein